MSWLAGPIDPGALLLSATGFVVAVGGVVKQIRDMRRERRSRRRDKKALEKVARAMAKDSVPVADVVDTLESTGHFQKFDGVDDDGRP